MNRASILGLMLLAACPLGCEAPHITSGRLQSHITGVALESTPPGSFVFCDFTEARLDGRPVMAELKPYRRLETVVPVKIEISQPTSDWDFMYNVLLGPPFGVPGARVDGWLKTSDPTFVVASDGWAFYWGRWPWATTRWVSAIATGSTFIVEVGNGVQRLYFLEGEHLHVDCVIPGGTSSITNWTTPNTYVTVTLDAGNCKFDPPDPNPHLIDATVQPFVDKVKAAATVAKWVE